MTKRQRRRKFVRFLKNHGFGYPRYTQMAVRVTGITRAEACALLTKETGGGRNVFGCDHGSVGDRPPYCHQTVTVRRLLALRRSGYFNGVGPTQLTYGGFVDTTVDPGDPRLLAKRMKQVGAAWAARPFLNIVKGFSIYQGYRKSGASSFEAATRYNGAEVYGHDFEQVRRDFQRKLDRIGL